MIFYSYYLAKTALVSFLMIASITFEATCSNSVSNLFNSIVGITSANEGEHSAASNSNQRPLELKLADAQMLQQWIGQIARKIIVEDGIFAGIYSCGPKSNIDAVILTDGLPEERIKKIDKNSLKKVQNSEEKSQFLKLLLSFGAMLSAEIGEQSQQNGTLRALLKAYECVGGKFAEEKDLAGSSKIKSDGFSDFVIGAIIKSPMEQLKVDKIILKGQPINNLNPPYIQELAFLNALNIEMTPKDVINFASFIHYAFLRINTKRQEVFDHYDVYLSNHILSYPTNPFEKSFLKENGLSLLNLGKDPVKYRRIAHQLLLHLKNWGLKELKEISSKKSFKNVIELTQREKCIFGIFTRNLMQKMDKFELLEDYFGELDVKHLVNLVKIEMEFYERLSAENCFEKSLPFFDEAIRIDWNVWKEIIQQIDEISDTVKGEHEKQKLTEYLESSKFKDAMQIIRAKFDENKFGLKLKADVKKKWKIVYETTPKVEINEFCSNLEKIRKICAENIEQYEKEIPFKRNVIIKQKENNTKFYDLMAIVVEHFGGNSIKNDNGESIEFDLNGAKSFLEKVYISAKELLQNKNLNFETAIKALLNKNLNEKTKNLLKEFYVPKKFVKIPRKSAEFQKEDELINTEAQLFELFFSFAARLEAIVHGKNIDGTIEKSRENSKDKIRAFLAVPNCFNVPEWANKFSIFDYWMEIKEINSKKSQKMPVIGVAIFRKIKENEEAKSISRGNYKTLKSLNEYKFSFYESTKLLRKTYDKIEHGNRSSSSELKIPEIITKSINQILSVIDYKWKNRDYIYSYYGIYIRGCEFAKLFQNISANFMKMQNVTLDKDTLDSKLQDWVKMDFEKFCKIIERIDRNVEETKIALLNNVRYDLVIDFKFNAWKDAHDITEDLLEGWTKNELSEENTFAAGNEKFMIEQIYKFTTETNQIRISKIEALKAKEKDGFDLMGLFNELDELAGKIKEEMPNLEKAKKELITVKGKKQIKEKKEEINILEKGIMKLAESARKMGKRLGQMLEEMKKHYGQKMDE